MRPPLTTPCPKGPSFSELIDVWEEDRENIQICEQIGSGNFGEVSRAIWRQKYVVAVKVLKNKDGDQPFEKAQKKEEFRKELEIMKKLSHENLVKLLCVCTNGEPALIVTEYMCNGSLSDYMVNGAGADLNFKECIDIAAQIASGMKYIECVKCVHRDLAARNILVGERNIVKIADFGLAQILNVNDKLELSQEESNKFPVKWTAPEVFSVDAQTGLRNYTIKSDVWSFGILLYELITLGGSPYPGWDHKRVRLEVIVNGYRMPKPDGLCTDSFYKIMTACWRELPISRPTFETLENQFNEYFIDIEPSYFAQD